MGEPSKELTSSANSEPIRALSPRDSTGEQFVCYGDCCSGIPGADFERNFTAVNAVLARLHPSPSWICFVGDEVMGMTTDYAALRVQWRYWHDHEMAWLDQGSCPIYHVTSNHTAYDARSEAVWKETHPDVPRNGPPEQEGLSYAVRRGNFLLVFTNTAFSGLGGNGHVEHAWLDRILSAHTDIPYKIVIGHHPVHAVNGYDEYPHWRIVPDQGEAFWQVLVRHGVLAYICSHVIAFDVQVHEGVLQVTTGGAGTRYGPGGFMPGQTEYHHLVQMALDRAGLRYQVLDAEGRRREWLSWPLSVPPLRRWQALQADGTAQRQASPSMPDPRPRSGRSRLVGWRFTGDGIAEQEDDQTLLCGWNDDDGPSTVWIGIVGATPSVVVKLQTEPGAGIQAWTGEVLHPHQPFDFQVAVHTGMGPGGILYRSTNDADWSSLRSSSARGAELLVWPARWMLGHGRSGAQDVPFSGLNLRASWYWEEFALT